MQMFWGTGNNSAELYCTPGTPNKQTLLSASISFQASKSKHAHRWTPSFVEKEFYLLFTMVPFNAVAFLHAGSNTVF